MALHDQIHVRNFLVLAAYGKKSRNEIRPHNILNSFVGVSRFAGAARRFVSHSARDDMLEGAIAPRSKSDNECNTLFAEPTVRGLFRGGQATVSGLFRRGQARFRVCGGDPDRL